MRIIVPGRVYRRDNPDATHNPTFQQIEGLYVDRKVTVSDLKGTVEFVFKDLLGSDTRIRFRPHYFSYTEPSFEIDFSCPLTRKMGKEWLEIAGCGMVHPKVFENVGYDPEQWTGWAFGFGIERIAMIAGGLTRPNPVRRGMSLYGVRRKQWRSLGWRSIITLLIVMDGILYRWILWNHTCGM